MTRPSVVVPRPTKEALGPVRDALVRVIEGVCPSLHIVEDDSAYRGRAQVCVGYSLSVKRHAETYGGAVAVVPDLPGSGAHLFDKVIEDVSLLARHYELLVTSNEAERVLLERSVDGAAGRVSHLQDSALGPRVRAVLSDAAVETGAIERRVAVVGHDLRHSRQIVHAARGDLGTAIDLVEWPLTDTAPSERVRWVLTRSDVLVCEWAGRQAVWASRNVAGSQRLVLRIHGFELDAVWFEQIDFDAVDLVVTVSEHLATRIRKRVGASLRRVLVIPNSVDSLDLARPKLRSARFHLGMLGYVPMLKRPDLALDLLERLLAEDERYHLVLRGQAPWELEWVWNRRLDERAAYTEVFRRVGRGPLREHVIFERQGADVSAWWRRSGWALSLSEHETFHAAAVEGMSSGAVPLVLERPGARGIFGEKWVSRSIDDIARRVLDARDEQIWRGLSVEASEAAEHFDHHHVRDAWREVFRGC